MDSSSSTASSAPGRPLPSNALYSVEYPGYVQNASVPLAIQCLGGQDGLETAFKRAKSDALVELKLRPENSFAHPIPGEIVPTNNIVLKVVKRRRKRKEGDPEDGALGEYTATAVGVVSKTVRFRSMADYQFQPNTDDRLTVLRNAMNNLDVQGIRDFRFQPEKEDYTLDAPLPPHPARVDDPTLDPRLQNPPTQAEPPPSSQPSGSSQPLPTSNLRMFPPPVFSRQAVPLNYGYKANPASVVSTTVDETGQEKKRLINRMRWKGWGPASIMFADEKIPEKPPQSVEAMRSQVDNALFKKLQDFFSARPIWTRQALMNQLSSNEARELVNSKVLLPLVCYVFQDGPYRDTLVRFGYDPRKDPAARIYQRIYFRNSNHPIERPSVINKRQDRVTRPEDRTEMERKTSHIFDGVSLAKETAAFQLCDIVDPMLKTMIQGGDDLRDVCDERDGWYSSHALERIKSVLRYKFFSLLDGYPVTDEECLSLLETAKGRERMASRHVPRPGKHNMAKGALRPEDAAALRLRAVLDKSNTKNVPS
ncbi:hypothetical protein ONZ45_g22 [Pleurotus djamor]|nr:hypothetical protein ONZ45_g22 [Pleurotus djamor]